MFNKESRKFMPFFIVPVSVFLISFCLLFGLNLVELLKSSKLAFSILISVCFGIGATVFVLFTRVKNEAKKLEKNSMISIKLIDEIRKKLDESEDLKLKYEKILEFISDIEPTVNMELFTSKILDFSLSLIPNVKFGTICTSKDGDIWSFTSVKGYNQDFLEKLRFEKKWFEYLKHKDTEIKIVENILENSRIPEHVREIIKSGLNNTPRKSIFGVFRQGKEILGFMTIDSMEDTNFSNETLEIMRFLVKITALFISIKKSYERKTIFQREVVKSMIRILELKDKYTKGHSERVAKLSVKIAQKMGLSDEEINMVYWAGIVHDIGKIGIPDEILNKPTRLTDEEYKIIKKHPVLGEQVLSQMSYLKELSVIVRHHHERWNGTGYPDGLRREEIPLLSRILAVADAFDAMTSDRSYRAALNIDKALKEIEKNAGVQFDADVVKAFFDLFSQVKEENIG